MNRYMTVGLSMLAGALLGAVAIETIHAQAKPPAFNIAEITVRDQDAYNKEYLPVITKLILAAGRP
jgi:hypothetical protein